MSASASAGSAIVAAGLRGTRSVCSTCVAGTPVVLSTADRSRDRPQTRHSHDAHTTRGHALAVASRFGGHVESETHAGARLEAPPPVRAGSRLRPTCRTAKARLGVASLTASGPDSIHAPRFRTSARSGAAAVAVVRLGAPMPPTPCGAGIILRRHPEPSRRPLITPRPLAGRCSALGRSCLMPSSPPGASDSRPSRPNHGGAAAGMRQPAPRGAPPIRRPRATGAPPACLLAVQWPGTDASGRESPLSAAFGVAAVAVDRIGAHRTSP